MDVENDGYFHFHLRKSAADIVDFRFEENLLKYFGTFRESYESNKEFRIFVEDVNAAQLEETLWQFVFLCLAEHEDVYGDEHDGATVPLHLEESTRIKVIQLNDLYKMGRAFNFYNIPLMLDLVLKTIVQRLFVMKRGDLLLSHPGIVLEVIDEQIYSEEIAKQLPIQRLNRAYNIRLLDMSSIFRQQRMEEDLVNLISSLYVAQTSNVLAINTDAAYMITQNGLFVCANYYKLKLHNNRDDWMALKTAPNAISVWCGEGHILILTADGLMSFGYNSYNQLGLANTDVVREPKRIDLEGVLSAACGNHHSLARTRNGVYSFGRNHFGQLGLGVTTSSKAPKQIHFDKGVEIKAIACGNDFSLFLSTDGHVYGCGRNLNGVLGQTPLQVTTKMLSSPVKIAMPASDTRIVAIAAGASHAIFLDDNGRVYTIGSNTNLQLGSGTSSDSFVAKEVHPSDSPIVAIVAGKNTSFYIDEEGDLFESGADYSRRLGLGDDVSLLPRKVELLAGKKVISVACVDDRFTCVLTCDGLYLLQPYENGTRLFAPEPHKMHIDVAEDSLLCPETALSSSMYSK